MSRGLTRPHGALSYGPEQEATKDNSNHGPVWWSSGGTNRHPTDGVKCISLSSPARR